MEADSPPLVKDLDELRQRRRREADGMLKAEQVARHAMQDQAIQRERRRLMAEQQRQQAAARRRQRSAVMAKSLRQIERDTRAAEVAQNLHTQNRVRQMIQNLDRDAAAGRLTAIQAGMLDAYRARAGAMGLKP